MSLEQYPRSIRGWLGFINENGVSSRPFPTEPSDLVNPATYPDPLNIKAERAALAGIFAVRAWQIAKPQLQAARSFLEQPSIEAIIRTYPESRADQASALRKKHEQLELGFNTIFAVSILEDREYLLKGAARPGIIEAYCRLESIVDPQIKHLQSMRGESAEPFDRSSVFADIYGGLAALPLNVEALIGNIYQLYWDKCKEIPDIREVLKKAQGSYDTFILPLASMHKGDAEWFAENAKSKQLTGGTGVAYELHTDNIAIKPDVMEKVRQHTKEMKHKRSVTTRCSFLTPAELVERFLEPSPDFDDPLRDTFDLYIGMLAA